MTDVELMCTYTDIKMIRVMCTYMYTDIMT